jgi:hypothetical protein
MARVNQKAMMTTAMVSVSQTGMKSAEKSVPVAVVSVTLEKSGGKKERAATLNIMTVMRRSLFGEDFCPELPCDVPSP